MSCERWSNGRVHWSWWCSWFKSLLACSMFKWMMLGACPELTLTTQYQIRELWPELVLAWNMKSFYALDKKLTIVDLVTEVWPNFVVEVQITKNPPKPDCFTRCANYFFVLYFCGIQCNGWFFSYPMEPPLIPYWINNMCIFNFTYAT